MSYLEQLFDLKNKVVLVTGATGHLGKTMVEAFASVGARVVCVSRTTQDLETLASQVKVKGLESYFMQADITQQSSLDRLTTWLEKEFGVLDVLINNAYNGKACSWDGAEREDFIKDYEISLIAPYQLTKACMPLLKKDLGHKTRSVINVSTMYAKVSPDPSVYGQSGMNNPPQYGAAKAALEQLTRYLACHVGSQGIRFNAISPGPFPGGDVVQNQEAFAQRLKAKVPLGRLGLPEDLLGALFFLASSASSYVNGITLEVNGGWTAW